MKLHFMKYRKLSYWVSGICVLLSILSIAIKGFNYGIDFSGGISMEVTPVVEDYTIDKMRHDLEAFKPELQAVDNNKQVNNVVATPIDNVTAKPRIGPAPNWNKINAQIKFVNSPSNTVFVERVKP